MMGRLSYGLVRRRAAAGATALCCAVGVAVPLVAAAPAQALTWPTDPVAVAHSSAGTLLTTTEDFAYSGVLDLVADDGRRVWRRELAHDPSLGGVSESRRLSMCADTVTSVRDEDDTTTGSATSTVTWWSTSTPATGSRTMAPNEHVVTSAPDGWVTSTVVDEENRRTRLTLHRTNGTSATLATIDGLGVGDAVCDDSAFVAATSPVPGTTALVRIPFDGSSVGIVTTGTEVELQPIALSGPDVLWRSRASTGGAADGPITVWHSAGDAVQEVLTAPDRVEVQGGSVSATGSLVCLSRAGLGNGCDMNWVPHVGTPARAETTSMTRLWPASGGFLGGCSGYSGDCRQLSRIDVPSLEVSPVYEMRLPVEAQRWDGADRYAVAARIALETSGRDGVVFLASGTSFPDALSVGATGARIGAPVLLTAGDRLPASTEEALRILSPVRLVVLGGTSTISEAVAKKAGAHAYRSVRIGGADRYAVAAAVSRTYTAAGTDVAYVVSGEVFPDGLVAATPAAQDETSVLLTAARRLPSASRSELQRLAPSRVVVIGGEASVGTEVVDAIRQALPGVEVQRISAPDRYTLSAEVSRYVLRERRGTSAYVATGTTFPDALALGPATGGIVPVLLVRPTALPGPVRDEIQRAPVTHLTVAGGTASVSRTVVDEILALPDLPPDVP